MSIVYKDKQWASVNTWGRIVEANKSINTTNIKGKEYAEVNQRVKAFRFVFTQGRIETSVEISGELGNRVCLAKATIYDDLGNVLANGYAEEKEGSTFINKTSFIENAETSAVGRALGFVGFGIDTSIASYEEVQNAKNNQSAKATANQIKLIKEKYEQHEALLKHYGISTFEELTVEQASELLKAKKDNANG